jgi:rhamnose utilization protein RhaD (predicted bifunctional aldolase and dehydrogenase)
MKGSNIVWALLASFLSLGYTPVQATDEQRQAYEKMVEESVKEADEYVREKQQEASDRHAQEQRDKEDAKRPPKSPISSSSSATISACGTSAPIPTA